MSRRKDMARFEAMKRINPDYKGFRGHQLEADRPGQTPLQAMTCTVCGRKRNVPVGFVLEQEDRFVCQNCLDEAKEQ